jgi:hypothetical protein
MPTLVAPKAKWILAASLSLFAIGLLRAQPAQPVATTLFQAEGDAIVSHNGPHYNDRPIYGGADSVFPIAGDRPVLRLIRDPYLYSSFLVAYVRGDHAMWLQDAADIAAQYRPDRMEWIVKDPAFAGTTLDLQMVPLAGTRGMAIRFQAHGAQAGDRLVWLAGSGKYWKRITGGTAFDPNPATASMGFVPKDCAGNDVQVTGETFTIRPAAGEAVPPAPQVKPFTVVGACSVASHPVITDAALWTHPLELAKGPAKDLPAVCGTLPVTDDGEVFWSVELSDTDKPVLNSPAQAFDAGLDRAKKIGSQVTVDTPDSPFNAAVGASCAVMDEIFVAPTFMHAPMNWRSPWMGWRSLFGSIAYGWHDRVDSDVQFLINTQIKDSTNTTAAVDPQSDLSKQGKNSCYFLGAGKLVGNKQGYQNGYDMQSQFFDQAIQNWRYTADPEMEKTLRPALEKHLAWMKTCFDPTDSGVYESYLNTWPTDDQWYNGGGTAEETAYAYRGHLAALDMARRAGDAQAVALHTAELEKIRAGFFKQLWIADKGHSGAYREQSDYQRLHEDCWMYSIFLPIDAGMLNVDQAASSLHFTEYGLERYPMPTGGERVITSNWVPAIRTVRNLHSGDEYALALAYFQTGLADEGWNVLNGTYIPAVYNYKAPGDLAGDGNGIDFSDSTNMFCRAVVEGVFGYTPDYPNGVVKIAPQFPTSWDHAAINTPDMSLTFTSKEKVISCAVELTKPAAMDIRVPVRTSHVAGVKVNGEDSKWELLPGFGNSIVRVQVPSSAKATVDITCTDVLPQYPGVPMEVTSGQQLALAFDGATVTEVHDPQGALVQPQVKDGKLIGEVSHNEGDHLVLALVKAGEAPQWRSLKLHVTDTQAVAKRAAAVLKKVPAGAKWDSLDLSGVFNGDIRTIYQQHYISPRPNTCSLRLADDGYRTWMMGKEPLPDIDLTGAAALLKGADQLVTPQGVPFRWSAADKNIAFTSRWDNWPKTVTVPVNKKGNAVWFLVCGSTNPMQTRIANAEIRLKYSDGVTETLSLVPPLNYWNLCPIDHHDYTYKDVGFCLPKVPPPTVQLGNNCRAMLLNHRLRDGVELESVTLETLSQEVVVGLMGVTVMTGGESAVAHQ